MRNNLYPQFGILLIDDEESFLRSMSIALERRGGFNHIYRCQDSRQAMQVIADEPIGLVLLDLTMPHVSGEELLQTIASDYPDISVIILSGLNQLEVALNCIRLGAYDYFVKTTEEGRLLEGIKRAIRMQEMRLENQALTRRMMSNSLEHPEAFDTTSKGQFREKMLESFGTDSIRLLETMLGRSMLYLTNFK